MTREFDSTSDSIKTDIEAEPFALAVAPGVCPGDKPVDPCIIVIIGASGDLATRKLAPALYKLYINDRLPDPFLIIGCGRTALNNESFRDRMKDALMSLSTVDAAQWQRFAGNLYYQTLHYDSLQSFKDLARTLKEIDAGHAVGGNKIFYLATPPFLYKTIS
ncbi:MAG: hypothetical protein NTZ51_05470, partial [Proteobacteria bacterium]|nr:hypothetical protein [Pseudomonadota bacterium]